MSTNPLRPFRSESELRSPTARDRRILAIPDLNRGFERSANSVRSTADSWPDSPDAASATERHEKRNEDVRPAALTAATSAAISDDDSVQTVDGDLTNAFGRSRQKLTDKLSMVAVAEVTRSLRHLSPRPKQSFFALMVVGVIGTAAFLLFQPVDSPDEFNSLGNNAPLVEIPDQIERMSQGPLRATPANKESQLLTRTPVDTVSTGPGRRTAPAGDVDIFHIPSLDSTPRESVETANAGQASQPDKTIVRREPLPEPFQIEPARMAAGARPEAGRRPSRTVMEQQLNPESRFSRVGRTSPTRYEQTDPSTFRDPPYDFPTLAGQRGRDVR